MTSPSGYDSLGNTVKNILEAGVTDIDVRQLESVWRTLSDEIVDVVGARLTAELSAAQVTALEAIDPHDGEAIGAFLRLNIPHYVAVTTEVLDGYSRKVADRYIEFSSARQE